MEGSWEAPRGGRFLDPPIARCEPRQIHMSEDSSSKTVAEMIADSLREAGLLTAVFGWLDTTVQGETFWGPWGWTVLGAALLLFVGGTALEILRSPRES